MIDREKVIKGLELCEFGSGRQCYEHECPYYQKECTEGLKADILTMMKAQEPKIIKRNRFDEIFSYIAKCPDCGFQWAMWNDKKMRYCPGCGRAVKWDEAQG